MKKLQLDLDTLLVSSFETAEATVDARGTVRGREGIMYPSLYDRTFCVCTLKPTRVSADQLG